MTGLIVAVPHEEYREKGVGEFVDTLLPGGCLVDVKSVLDKGAVERTGVDFWRL